MIDIPIKLSKTPGEIRSLGVQSGANTDEILTGLGLFKKEIERLRKAGVVEG